MASFKRIIYLVISLGLVGEIVALRLAADPDPEMPQSRSTKRVVRRPAWPSGLDGAPAEVREFLDRVLAKVPAPASLPGAAVTGYQFHDWVRPGKPTRESVGLKPIEGVDPETLIARVMDVDGYARNIDHVDACRSIPDPAFTPPGKVRFFQTVGVPGVVDVQQELVLVDAGTVQGYRVAYWYLLEDRTRSLDRKAGARSEFNVGAWLAAPGVVGYALSTWPRRQDVNAFQWFSLTAGANALAKKIVEDNIDGMAAWAKKAGHANHRK